MRKLIIGALCALLVVPAVGSAAVKTGTEAPNFTAVDSNGTSHQLSDFRGKIVVLEWTNHECPFVEKHYETKNMQNLQMKYTGKGVIWLSINSGAPGKQGYVDGAGANEVIKKVGAHQTAYLLDPEGKIGKLYGARTTPHMFIIDAQGSIAYSGAIDDNDSSRTSSVKDATNYVAAALDSMLAGQQVKTASTEPYGCSVKYK